MWSFLTGARRPVVQPRGGRVVLLFLSAVYGPRNISLTTIHKSSQWLTIAGAVDPRSLSLLRALLINEETKILILRRRGAGLILRIMGANKGRPLSCPRRALVVGLPMVFLAEHHSMPYRALMNEGDPLQSTNPADIPLPPSVENLSQCGRYDGEVCHSVMASFCPILNFSVTAVGEYRK